MSLFKRYITAALHTLRMRNLIVYQLVLTDRLTDWRHETHTHIHTHTQLWLWRGVIINKLCDFENQFGFNVHFDCIFCRLHTHTHTRICKLHTYLHKTHTHTLLHALRVCVCYTNILQVIFDDRHATSFVKCSLCFFSLCLSIFLSLLCCCCCCCWTVDNFWTATATATATARPQRVRVELKLSARICQTLLKPQQA